MIRPMAWTVVAATMAVALICSCSADPATPAAPKPTTSTTTAPSTAQPTKRPTPAKPRTIAVPDNLVGKTVGTAKARLRKAGFTNVVVAGVGVTDASTVVDVPEAGDRLARSDRVRVIGKSSAPQAQSEQAPNAGNQPDPAVEPDAVPQPDSGSAGNCAERAMAVGKFDPNCPTYQGYLDPGTIAGRGPTSGEVQSEYWCQQGRIPESQC